MSVYRNYRRTKVLCRQCVDGNVALIQTREVMSFNFLFCLMPKQSYTGVFGAIINAHVAVVDNPVLRAKAKRSRQELYDSVVSELKLTSVLDKHLRSALFKELDRRVGDPNLYEALLGTVLGEFKGMRLRPTVKAFMDGLRRGKFQSIETITHPSDPHLQARKCSYRTIRFDTVKCRFCSAANPLPKIPSDGFFCKSCGFENMLVVPVLDFDRLTIRPMNAISKRCVESPDLISESFAKRVYISSEAGSDDI